VGGVEVFFIVYFVEKTSEVFDVIHSKFEVKSERLDEN
jgi:hypothetical protein